MQETNRELTNSRWEVIEKLFDDQRKRWYSLWKLIITILSTNRTGAQWRESDSKCPPWQSVYLYHHFRQFKLTGIWEPSLDSLVIKEWVEQKREETPSWLAIDSQFVNTFVKGQIGIGGNKCFNGRKRSLAVERLGLLWAVAVTSANTFDNQAGKLAHDQPKGKVRRSKVIAVDQSYKVSFIEYA